MNKKTALKATLILLMVLGVTTGVVYLMSHYKEITGYVAGGLFLGLIWIMIYDGIEKTSK